FSVRDSQGPLLQDGSGPYGLRPEGEALIAGVLEQLPGLVALASPSPVSYLRLVPSSWSAPFQVWGMENREAAVRFIPTARDQSAAHLEIKAVDPTANPYLLLGALQAQVLDALRHQRTLPPEQTGDPALITDHTIPRLPASLVEARIALERDAVLLEAMGPPRGWLLLPDRSSQAVVKQIR
ncbi:glutamine synthetase, partial [bacterium]|nr:glutamine synthetase [bacterium]